MNNTSTIQIKTDFDCKVYDYGQELGTTKADTYFNVELCKGEHELTLVYSEDESISTIINSDTINYIVEKADCDNIFVVNISRAIIDKAKDYLAQNNFPFAFSLFLKVAKRGYAEAQYIVGACYENEIGVEKDLTKAVEWYTKAALQGYIMAQNDLGICLRDGTGVDKDPSEAIKWLTKAASHGCAKAALNLALSFAEGNGVKKDLAKAEEWYTKAASLGDAIAQCYLGVCYEFGSTSIEKDLSKAVEWYTKAAEQGFTTAQCKLGLCYENGKGVKKDFNKAMKWYRQAATQGDEVAQSCLIHLLQTQSFFPNLL